MFKNWIRKVLCVMMICIPAAQPFRFYSGIEAARVRGAMGEALCNYRNMQLRPKLWPLAGVPQQQRQRGITMSTDADMMQAFSRALKAAGDHTVAAAAILGENQCDEEEPGSLSAGGCAISNAGRDAELIAAALSARNWEDATGPLQACAGSLFGAAASFGDLAGSCGVALGEAGIEIEDASKVTGCMVLAAAAGPSLWSAGETIASAGGALGAHGTSMAKSGGVYAEAGKRLYQAGACLAEAGEALERSGIAIENVSGNR